MSLATTESSFVQHTTKSIQGFDHPDYPAMCVAQEVLNAQENYLWVNLLYNQVQRAHLNI